MDQHVNSELTTATPYPIDFDSISKGDVITVKQLEEIYGAEYGTKEYNLACMKLIEAIHLHTARKGCPMRARVDKGAIRILTDSEGVQYAEDRHEASIRSMIRNHAMASATIDAANLTVQERQQEVENQVKRGRALIAINKTEKRLKRRSRQDNLLE